MVNSLGRINGGANSPAGESSDNTRRAVSSLYINLLLIMFINEDIEIFEMRNELLLSF